ncbi:MAG: aminotransferase class III-fold pyridoxal phosphate-dependent enzyme [Desulfobacterales bacterium]|nr:aminotransferase class III-fold pyridoxal phosphate-dependent enzyme [Desulfobacterales bacterium]
MGHCHPHVVKAVSRQIGALNTNTRYLFRNILDYAERITSGMPDKLSVCVFVNSGSEANDIALRMARFVTGKRGALFTHNAYHGITETIAELSPYEVKEEDLAPHVRTLMSPDPYLGIYKHGDADLAERYAADTDRTVKDLAKNDFGLSACMVDTAYISNGIPDVIENEELMANATTTGESLRQGIRSLMSRHSIIGDVRGRGMLAGVELVRDRKTLEPADTETRCILDLLRDNGVFVGTEGPCWEIY